MNNTYTLSNAQLTSVTVAASTVVKISESSTTTPGRRLFTFPIRSAAGTVYVMMVKASDSAPDATAIQNYGTEWTADDKACELPVNESHDIYAYTVAGMTVYPQEWV